MNQQFRDHVTSGQFVLALTGNMIAWLVHMSTDPDHYPRSPRSVPDSHALQRRGLVVHHYPPMGFDGDSEAFRVSPDRDSYRPRDFYEITRAGELVIELLRESGIYEEVLRA